MSPKRMTMDFGKGSDLADLAGFILGNAIDNAHDMGREEADEMAKPLGYEDGEEMQHRFGQLADRIKKTGKARFSHDVLEYLLESMEAELWIVREEKGRKIAAQVKRELKAKAKEFREKRKA